MRTRYLFLPVVLIALLLCSCTMKRDRMESDLGYTRLYRNLSQENRKLEHLRDKEQRLIASSNKNATQAMEPLYPSYNPLEEVRISLNVQDESLHNVLYVLARNAGLNLIIEPGIDLDNRVTVSFENARSSTVLEKLLKAYDLSWEVRDNLLYVQRYTERTFVLDFLNSRMEMLLVNGGDIFGTALEEGGSGTLTSNFQVSSAMGKGLEENSLYFFLAQSIQSILLGSSGEEQSLGEQNEQMSFTSAGAGSFVLDPLAGTLYVKTTPARMQAVTGLIENIRSKLTRQVVIDARILEVSLLDEFRMGIDWSYITETVINGFDFDLQLNWSGLSDNPTLGSQNNPLAIIHPQTGTIDGTTITATIEALQTFGAVKVISNPHVRARHGQPALFTSGTSQNYVRSITREEEEQDINNGTTFEIEVAQVFDGVMLGVVPFVAENQVDLQIFPIKSDVDPASLELVDVTGSGDRITLPRIDVKNVSTNVRVADGDTIILGGLIDKVTNKEDQGVPGLSTVPGLGWLFNTRQDLEEVREMVIIMHIQVI